MCIRDEANGEMSSWHRMPGMSKDDCNNVFLRSTQAQSLLCGTACYAFPDENRVDVTAAQRAKMSTEVVERQPAKHTRGSGRQ